MNLFLGAQCGRRSLHASVLRQDGRSLAEFRVRLGQLHEINDNLRLFLEQVQSALTAEQWDNLRAVCLGVEKFHRSHLNVEGLRGLLPSQATLICVPAPASHLLGAYPGGPAVLTNLGADLKLTVIDSTLTYREFRLNEGGGNWWLAQLQKLSEHSPRLSREFSRLGPAEPADRLRYLPRLLELGDFPGPDPVLKPKLDKISETVADRILAITARLPGVRRVVLGGFLHPGSVSERIVRHIKSEAPGLRVVEPRFLPEVGAALFGLAHLKENEERNHLGKPRLEGFVVSGKDWTSPPDLVRRLHRTRKPFEEYSFG